MSKEQRDVEEVTVAADATAILAAKAAGWTVFEHDGDDFTLMHRVVIGEQHTVCINPSEKLFATRSINNEPTDKTGRMDTLLGWLIGSALRDAEHQGSEGEFTYLTAV